MGRADGTAARGHGRFVRRFAECPGSGCASYLIALGARVVREVGDLDRRAKEAGKRLATLGVDTEVRFRSASDRAAFTAELTAAVAKLVSKYHDESAPGGRAHRLVVVAHPLPQKSDSKEPT